MEVRSPAFFPRTIRVWNNLPAETVQVPSIATFMFIRDWKELPAVTIHASSVVK